MTTDRSRFAKYRDRLRGGPPRVLAEHGTVAAARRHQRADEPLCGPCAEVWRAHQAEMYRRRKSSAIPSAQTQAPDLRR